MTENEIRNRTALLLDAYISLIGAGYSPSIQDFLLLRREAIKELSGNITDMTVRSAIKSEENHYRERNNAPENTNDRGLSRTVYGRTTDSHMNRQQAVQQSHARSAGPETGFSKGENAAENTGYRGTDIQTATTRGQPKRQDHVTAAPKQEQITEKNPLSDFEILRSIKDSWN
jgi:hypothetical protein